jgi:hypothetical protein
MEEIAKLFVLLVALALFMALAQHGSGGASAWWRAKFLGQPGKVG